MEMDPAEGEVARRRLRLASNPKWRILTKSLRAGHGAGSGGMNSDRVGGPCDAAAVVVVPESLQRKGTCPAVEAGAVSRWRWRRGECARARYSQGQPPRRECLE